MQAFFRPKGVKTNPFLLYRRKMPAAGGAWSGSGPGHPRCLWLPADASTATKTGAGAGRKGGAQRNATTALHWARVLCAIYQTNSRSRRK